MGTVVTLGSIPRGITTPGRVFARKKRLGLTPDTPLTITEQPQSVTVSPGHEAGFSVSVIGGFPPYTFVWLEDHNESLYHARKIDYPSTPRLFYTQNLADTTIYIWCSITDSQGVNIISHYAKLTTTGGLSIKTQPASVSCAKNGVVHLTVEPVGGALPYTFQWYELIGSTGTLLAGATNATYDPVTSTVGSRQYYVKIKDALGVTITSQTAMVTVGGALSIVAQPQSQTIASGTTAQMSVIVNGGISPYSFQWEAGESPTASPIDGAKAQVYTTPTLTTQHKYWVKITDAAGQIVNSATATISIATSALYIKTQPQSVTIEPGGSATLSVEPANGAAPYGFQWYKYASGAGTIILGAESSAYIASGLAAGTTTEFYCVITDHTSPTPQVATSARASVIVADAVVITLQPASQSVTLGDDFQLSTAADGGIGTLTYQWQDSPDHATWTDLTDKKTPSITLTASESGPRYYRCKVTDGGDVTVTSEYATITVSGEFKFTTQPISQTINFGQQAHFTVEVDGGKSPIKFQWYMETSDDAMSAGDLPRDQKGVDYGTTSDFDTDYAYDMRYSY